uniref:NADH:ubiquinone reductase (H(+)-translocating) n=1 Tax=Marshallagia marshalli TaxID=106947 RepID=A0A343QXG4_9BILA|nr:NADH dehydrogenase subunit 5 [Marshallagia marshalli]ATV81507.1 NADH dehydrogenase subunit 5 [Marshallagia marshalli]
MNVLVFFISLTFFLFLMFINFIPSLKLSLYVMEWDFLSFKLNFYFNSLLFSLILSLVTLSVLVFSTYYLNGELNFNYYLFMLLIFVGSMFMLNYSNNVYLMLISWDILGISSFFLVLFYNNWDSNSGAMNTALTNRLGDFFLFVFFSSFLFYSYYFLSIQFVAMSVLILLLLTSFTKSAQFPFSSWLPKAMSAPTPVSSLVHSSTLVTAGLILLMNFSNFLLNNNLMLILLLIGLFTMLFSSVTALVEEDMKKVVALSTLSQMGFSTLTLGMGLSFVTFVHLISHALFKSCLFMQIGYIIHGSNSQQDGRNYSFNGLFPMFVQMQLLITLLCLCGLMFSSGMVSKDLILEMFFFNNNYLMLNVLFFVSVFLTFGYSYRLWNSLFHNSIKTFFNFNSSYVINFLSLVLVLLSVLFLWWLNINLFTVPTVFLYLDLFTPLFYIFFLLMFVYWVFKILIKELIYKFLVDYLAKNVIVKVKNLKFVDLWLNVTNYKGFNVLNLLSYVLNYYMSTFKHNNLIFLLFFIFLLL